MRTTLAGLALLALTGNTLAANTGELWEVSTTMNIPGMPAGMGARTSRVCTDKNESPAGGRNDCKVSNVKRSGLTESMTMTCPDATMNVEMTYNAGRTEYKGKMTMKSRDGDMEMNTSGRKVGACDPQVAKAEVEKKAADMNKKLEGSLADARARNQETAKRCQAAVEPMNAHDLQMGFTCYSNPRSCQTDAQDRMGQRPMFETCKAAAAEFCKRFQTMEGFTKAKGDEDVARTCKVSTSQLKASFCPRAEKADDFDFVTAYCPAEKDRLLKKHCVGRSYTSLPKRIRVFCQGNLDEGLDTDSEDRKSSKPAAQTKRDDAKKDSTPKNTVGDGVNQGINKLRGLFGR